MIQLHATREYETKEQRDKRIKAIFDSFDRDKNGTIELNEFIQGLSIFFNFENLPSAETYKRFFTTIFNMCDKGGFFKRKNSKLDIDEFTRIANAMPLQFQTDIKVNLAKMMFNIIDENSSGKISKKEVAKFLKCSDFPDIFVKEYIKDLDENGDGEIDFKEFYEWFRTVDIYY